MIQASKFYYSQADVKKFIKKYLKSKEKKYLL